MMSHLMSHRGEGALQANNNGGCVWGGGLGYGMNDPGVSKRPHPLWIVPPPLSPSTSHDGCAWQSRWDAHHNDATGSLEMKEQHSCKELQVTRLPSCHWLMVPHPCHA